MLFCHDQCFFCNLQSFLGSYKKILDFFVQRTKKARRIYLFTYYLYLAFWMFKIAESLRVESIFQDF